MTERRNIVVVNLIRGFDRQLNLLSRGRSVCLSKDEKDQINRFYQVTRQLMRNFYENKLIFKSTFYSQQTWLVFKP